MNDEMEGFDLYSVLSEVLELKHGSEQCKNTLEWINDLIQVYLRHQMCFSASTLKDDISQWRAYTKLGQGVCIEFTDGFVVDPKAQKVQCLYDFDDKKTAIVADQHLKSNDETMMRTIQTQEGLRSYIKSIIQTLVRFKNASFKPEQEVRWVYNFNGLTDADAQFEFRPHRLGLTSYHKSLVDISKITSITIGPQVPTQNLKSIEDFLILKRCPLVEKSSVSLR